MPRLRTSILGTNSAARLCGGVIESSLPWLVGWLAGLPDVGVWRLCAAFIFTIRAPGSAFNFCQCGGSGCEIAYSNILVHGCISININQSCQEK